MNYDAIRNNLYSSADHRRDIALARANAAIEAIQKAHEAYLDGVDAAIGAIERLPPEKPIASPERGAEPAAAPKDGLCRLRRMTSGYISPARLKAAIEEDRLDELISPFDEIDIPLDTGGTVTVVCGYAGTSGARFVFKDCWGDHIMNEENTNKTGYYGSDARKYILEDIYPRLPREWKDIIKPRQMSEVINGETVKYDDPLWLPSATDVFGSPNWKWWPDEPDSFRLPIYEKKRNRVKESGGNGTCIWWLRSVYATSTSVFCRVHADGSASSGSAYISLGFAPGFDIKSKKQRNPARESGRVTPTKEAVI